MIVFLSTVAGRRVAIDTKGTETGDALRKKVMDAMAAQGKPVSDDDEVELMYRGALLKGSTEITFASKDSHIIMIRIRPKNTNEQSNTPCPR